MRVSLVLCTHTAPRVITVQHSTLLAHICVCCYLVTQAAILLLQKTMLLLLLWLGHHCCVRQAAERFEAGLLCRFRRQSCCNRQRFVVHATRVVVRWVPARQVTSLSNHVLFSGPCMQQLCASELACSAKAGTIGTAACLWCLCQGVCHSFARWTKHTCVTYRAVLVLLCNLWVVLQVTAQCCAVMLQRLLLSLQHILKQQLSWSENCLHASPAICRRQAFAVLCMHSCSLLHAVACSGSTS